MGCACICVISPAIGSGIDAEEPDDGAASGATTIIATLSNRQPMLANVSETYEVVRLSPGSAAYLAARDALERPCVAVELLEVSLRDAVAQVADQAGTPIGLDMKALDDMGIDAETPVTFTGRSESLKSCLLAILDDLELALVFRHGRFVVTSGAVAAEELEQVLYPIPPDADADEMADMIEGAIEPVSWATSGGPCSIAVAPVGLGNGLIVSQTGPVHDKIEALLRNLDAAHWNASQADEGARPRFMRIYEIDDDFARMDLEEKLVDLVNDSLPHGADTDAEVSTIGRSLVVRSRTPPFQVMAAQIIAATTGAMQEFEVDSSVFDMPVEESSDEPASARRADPQGT